MVVSLVLNMFAKLTELFRWRCRRNEFVTVMG